MKGSRLAADVVSLCGRSVLESGDGIQGRARLDEQTASSSCGYNKEELLRWMN